MVEFLSSPAHWTNPKSCLEYFLGVAYLQCVIHKELNPSLNLQGNPTLVSISWMRKLSPPTVKELSHLAR